MLIGVSDLTDVDALCERARRAGAQITEEPTDQAYGERRFGAADPEGHDGTSLSRSPTETRGLGRDDAGLSVSQVDTPATSARC